MPFTLTTPYTEDPGHGDPSVTFDEIRIRKIEMDLERKELIVTLSYCASSTETWQTRHGNTTITLRDRSDVEPPDLAYSDFVTANQTLYDQVAQALYDEVAQNYIGAVT